MYVIYSEETCIFWSRNKRLYWHRLNGPAYMSETGRLYYYRENRLEGTENVQDLQQ